MAGLPEPRAIDLVLAVSEVAANTVRHAKSPGSLKIWYDTEEIVCQIHDDGIITDPLAGLHRPSLKPRAGTGSGSSTRSATRSTCVRMRPGRRSGCT